MKFQSSVADPSETHTIVRQGFTLTGWLNVTLNQTFTFGADEIKDNTVLKAIWKGEENIPYRLVLEYEDKDTPGLDLVSRPANRNMNLTAGIQKTFTLTEFLTYFNDFDADALLLDKSLESSRVRDKNPSVPRIINVDPIQKTITVMIDPSVSGYNPNDNQITVKLLVRRHAYTFELHEGTGLNNLTNLIAGRNLLNQAEHISQDPVRTGYRFLGFKKDINSSTLYTRDEINSEPVMSDLTLHAIWEAIVHKVTFETLSGSVIDEVTLTGAPAAVEEQNIAHNSLLDNTNDKLFLTSQSHVFKYWSETEGGAEFDVKTQPILKDMKLYAVWEAKVFRVSFVTKTDEITIPDQHVKWGKEVVDPRTQGTEMVRDGFVFRFFSLAANGNSGEYQFSNKVYEETSIYAVYKVLIMMPSNIYYRTMGVKYGDKFYTWGNNTYGQAGVGDTERHLTPTLVPKSSYGNKKIKQLAFGSNSSYLLTTTNELYAWGYNGNGQLGLGDTENRLTPTLVPASYYGNKQIKKIVAGADSIYLLTEDGDVYVWGLNNYGQLGFGDTNDRLTPTLLPKSSYGNETVKDIYAFGLYSFYILTTSSSVYVCGRNLQASLGWDTGHEFETSLIKLPPEKYDNREIETLLIGMYNGAMYTKDGKIYQWGYNHTYILFFNFITNEQPIKLVTGDYPYDHNVASINGYTALYYWENKLYAFGVGSDGQFGDGQTHTEHQGYVEISYFNDKNVIEVKTGNVAMFAVVDTVNGHKLYSWGGQGHNDDVSEYLILGLGHINNQLYPDEVQFPEV